MEIKNCPECGKVFSAVSGDICPECQKIEEEEYEKVYKFLKEHPFSSIEKVSAETGVSRRKILKFLRKGEITGAETSREKKSKCYFCGTPISGGKLCQNCAKELTEKLKGKKETPPAKKTISEKEKGEMYIFNRIKKKKEER